jgi:hypothetical protein
MVVRVSESRGIPLKGHIVHIESDGLYEVLGVEFLPAPAADPGLEWAGPAG